MLRLLRAGVGVGKETARLHQRASGPNFLRGLSYQFVTRFLNTTSRHWLWASRISSSSRIAKASNPNMAEFQLMRSCRVYYRDGGVERQVFVSAVNRYHAFALAMQEMRRQGWCS